MTLLPLNANVVSMVNRTGKPVPRESKTPLEYKMALARRIKERREKLELTIAQVADQLSHALKREVRADTYRKWETIESIVQVDAILPLCDILRMHVFELLDKPTAKEALRPAVRGKAVA